MRKFLYVMHFVKQHCVFVAMNEHEMSVQYIIAYIINYKHACTL